MSYRAIAEALETLAATFTLAGVVVQQDGVYMPVSGVPYLKCELSGYNDTPAGFGANSMMQQVGTFQLSVMRPSTEGVKRGRDLADRLVALFKRGTNISLPNGQTLIIDYTSPQPAQIHGDWISVPVVVNWFASLP